MKNQIKKIVKLSTKEMKAVKGGSNVSKTIKEMAMAAVRNMQ